MTKTQNVVFISKSIGYIVLVYFLFLLLSPFIDFKLDNTTAITIVIGCLAISIFSDSIFKEYIEFIIEATIQKVSEGASEKELKTLNKLVTFIINIDLAIIFQMIVLLVALICFLMGKCLSFFKLSILVFILLIILNITIKYVLRIIAMDLIYKKRLYGILNEKNNEIIKKLNILDHEISSINSKEDIIKIRKEIDKVKTFNTGIDNFMKLYNKSDKNKK